MRRTELSQEIGKMRFEEAYRGWQAKRLTQEEVARLLASRYTQVAASRILPVFCERGRESRG